MGGGGIDPQDEGEWTASRPGYFTPGGKSHVGTHWVGDWVGSKVSFDAVEDRKIS
jgi:hypothetical protein